MNFQRLQEIQELVVWPVLGDMDKKNEIPEVIDMNPALSLSSCCYFAISSYSKPLI